MKYLFLFAVLGVLSCSSIWMKTENSATWIDQLQRGEDVHVVGATFESAVNFFEVLNLHNLYIATQKVDIRGNLYFQDCTFKGEMIGYIRQEDNSELLTNFKGDVSFVNCTFEKEVNFNAATFFGQLHMVDCKFRSVSNFKNITCSQRASFKGTLWNDEAWFQNAKFYHTTNFMNTLVFDNFMFQGAYFHDDVHFSLSETHKYVDFSLCRFYGDGNFNYIKWKDRAVFNNSVWMLDCVFTSPTMGSVNFSDVEVRGDRRISNVSATGERIGL